MSEFAILARTFHEFFRLYWRDDHGAAAIEYGLIIAGIALTIVGALFAVGDDLSSIFNYIGSNISSAHDAGTS